MSQKPVVYSLMHVVRAVFTEFNCSMFHVLDLGIPSYQTVEKLDGE